MRREPLSLPTSAPRRASGAWILALAAGVAAACSSEEPPVTPPPDSRDVEAPPPCTLAASGTPSCVPLPDAPSAEGGAGGFGGGATDDAGCLGVREWTLSCPTALKGIEALSDGEDGVVVLVRAAGRNGLENGVVVQNGRSYVAALRSQSSESELDEELLDPIVSSEGEVDPATTVTLLAPHDDEGASFFAHTGAALTRSGLFGDTSTEENSSFGAAPGFTTRALHGRDGRVVFGTRSSDGTTTVLDGFPDGPITSTTSQTFALATKADDELAALVSGDAGLELRGGERLERVDWSSPEASYYSDLDLVFFEHEGREIPAAIWNDQADSGLAVHLLDPEAGTSSAGALGAFAADCPGWSIGLSCDDCPVGQRCSVTTDLIRGARAFSDGERLFVAAIVSEERSDREVVRDTNPFIGCSCQANEIDSMLTADYLVVSEMRPRDGASPERVEVARVDLGAAQTYHHLGLFRDAPGSLVIVLGPSLVGATQGVGSFDEARSYRIVRLDSGGGSR